MRINQPEIPVAAPEPYPTVGKHGPSPRIVQLAAQDMAYTRGEMTSVYQYTYQHWILRTERPELSTLLMRIAEVEMRHLNILGGLICTLGGEPRCRSMCGPFWSGNMVFYGRDIHQILQRNIAGEQDAVDIYESQARFIKDPEISSVFARLAMDERIHLALFKEALANL